MTQDQDTNDPEQQAGEWANGPRSEDRIESLIRDRHRLQAGEPFRQSCDDRRHTEGNQERRNAEQHRQQAIGQADGRTDPEACRHRERCRQRLQEHSGGQCDERHRSAD